MGVFLNLTLGQFALLMGAVSAFSVALYLLDRARRRQVVSTLRFWAEPGEPAPVTRKKKIQQPFSLLLQLLGMLFLLLAVAQFQFGTRENSRRDHVVLLDTSSWMAALLPGQNEKVLLDQAKANALAWLRAVPSKDRVMLVRADGLSTPATSWETDHRAIAKAILSAQPGSTVLNLVQAVDFARQVQQQSGSNAGEIVYVGPGRVAARDAGNIDASRLRVLAVDDSIENVGLRSVGARRSTTSADVWDVLVRVRNYGRQAKTVNATLNFGNAPQGSKPILIPAGEEREVTLPVRTRAAGLLEIRLYPQDGFGADNYAALELPQQRTLHVVVYTNDAAGYRAALSADPRVRAEFKFPEAFTPANDGLVILDRFRPSSKPTGNVLWVDPPQATSPVSVRERVEDPTGVKWAAGQPITEGLRSRDLRLGSVSVFNPAAGDTRIAEIEKGPVAISRANDGGGKLVVIGFNPFAGAMRFELATPLLLGNMLRWVAPDVFRDVDVSTQGAGTISAPLLKAAGGGEIQVLNEAGVNLPFNVQDKSIQFFAGEPSRVRVISGTTERVYSLTLPEMWDTRWTPPTGVRRGIPARSDTMRRNLDLWPFLALIGLTFLLVEWFLYARSGISRLHVVRRTA